jgi:hypothetical protein
VAGSFVAFQPAALSRIVLAFRSVNSGRATDKALTFIEHRVQLIGSIPCAAELLDYAMFLQ